MVRLRRGDPPEGLGQRRHHTAGHLTGDEVLRAVGQAFRETVPDADAVFRLGGDEFAALIEDVGTSAALDVARRVVDAAHAILGRHGSALSIGVARIESDVDRLAVLRGADDAPYRAKREGLGAAYATEVQA